MLHVAGLVAPNTLDTAPGETLQAFGDHGQVAGAIPRHGGDAEQVLAAFHRAGLDLGQLGARLQEEGAKAFVASWRDLLAAIDRKGSALG